jgi:hypothetical protein
MTAQQQMSREKLARNISTIKETYHAGDGWTFVKAEEEVTTTT